MPLVWMSLRWTASHRPLTAILLVLLIVASLYTLLRPHSFHFPPYEIQRVFESPFKISLDVDPQSSAGAPGQEHSMPLEKHTISPDGLLVVNPNGPHPIFQLIRDAEVVWETKRARASKTLDEAVGEYKQRYRRAPPLGFDKWWDYVVQHDVQLPDEYDEIFEDIEPFWGIDPAELVHAQEEVGKRQGFVIVEKKDANSPLEVAGSTLSQDREGLVHTVKNILSLIREVDQDLPPMRMIFNPFDNPSRLSDWWIKTTAREAAANGMTLAPADLPSVTEEGWIQACPPHSPARLNPPSLPSQSATTFYVSSLPKTFVASHRDTMDPCKHPSLFSTHGQFLSHNTGPFPQPMLVPQFSLCSTLLHHDIRAPLPYGWDFNAPDLYWDGAFEGDVPWERKVDERLGWRGRTTGMWAAPDTLWVHGHRARLVTFTSALEGNASVLHVPDDQTTPVGDPEMMRLALVNPAWMDVAFAGEPVGCDEDGGTCSEMETLWEFRKLQERETEGRYKFILDVDGNGWSGRFKRLMTSNALIFKATIYPEWYTSRVAPWVHYVPIQLSYSDLYDAVSFFRAHDELAGRIAKAGRDWSQQFWRREDLTAYLYRLLLEYARVTSLDRASMSYIG